MVFALGGTGELASLASLYIDGVEIALTVAGTDKGQVAAVGGPGQILDEFEVGYDQSLAELLVVEIPEQDAVAGPFFWRRKRSCGRPAPRPQCRYRCSDGRNWPCACFE